MSPLSILRLVKKPVWALSAFLFLNATAYVMNGANVGAIVYKFDSTQRLADREAPGGGGQLVAVAFIVKESAGMAARYAVDVQEMGSAEVVTGPRSRRLLDKGLAAVVRERYLSLTGLELDGRGTSEFLVVGTSTGGKLGAGVTIDGNPVAKGYVLTGADFVLFAASMLILGGIVGALLLSLVAPAANSRQEALQGILPE